MIRVAGLKKAFDGVPSVNQVSFRAEKGRRIALIGPSGAGKTTLLRLIAGLERPDSGTVFIDGIKVDDGPSMLVPPEKRKIGMIFQGLALWPHLTACQNLEFVLKNSPSAKKRNKKERREAIHETATSMGIEPLLKKYPGQLSEGQKQRLAIGRAMIAEPDILLMDEPLSHLDAVLRKEILRLIVEQTRKRNTALVYVTHQKQEAFFIADEVMVLENGRMTRFDRIEEIERGENAGFLEKFLDSI